MSEPCTDAIVSLLLPTPTASDGKAWTLLSKTDVQGSVYRYAHSLKPHATRLINYFAYIGQSPNQAAAYTETMMGFPPGWTDLDA
jgi:hypothetical protein